MSEWKYKSCPRCKGDLELKRNEDIWEEKCLQCGYTKELRKVDVSDMTVEEKKRKEIEKRGQQIAALLENNVSYIRTVFDNDGALLTYWFRDSEKKTGMDFKGNCFEEARDNLARLRKNRFMDPPQFAEPDRTL